MNTATLGCQHADPGLVLPLEIETHKERRYSVHVEALVHNQGFHRRQLNLQLCLVCGQVFVPADECIEVLNAVIESNMQRAREKAVADDQLRQREAHWQEHRETAAERKVDLAANHGIPASRRPK